MQTYIVKKKKGVPAVALGKQTIIEEEDQQQPDLINLSLD